MWDTRCPRLATPDFRRMDERNGRHLSPALPPMPHTLAYQRMGVRSLALCAMSAMLSPGTHYVERAILSSATLDRSPLKTRCDSLPLCCVPMQLRELPLVQGTLFV